MKDIRDKGRVIETYSLIFIDIACAMISFALAVLIRYAYNVNGPLDKDSAMIACLFVLLCSSLYNVLIDGNRGFFVRGKSTEFSAIIKCTVVVLITSLVLIFFTQSAKNLSRMVLVLYAVLNVFITYVAHLLYKNIMLKYYKSSEAGNKVLLVSSTERIESSVRQLQENMLWDKKIVAACVMDAVKINYDVNGIPVIANEEGLFDCAKRMALDEILIDLPNYNENKLMTLMEDLQLTGAVCHCCVPILNISGCEKVIDSFGSKAVVSYKKKTIDFRRALVKRAIDIAGATVGLLITAVVTPFVALAIKIEAPGPVFFSQERVGRNGRRFKIYKFRSMYMDAEERKKELMEKNQMSGLMFKMDDDPRITKVGKFIRKTSIDELPQFYNILIGQMSLVGTRPPTVDEFEQYSLYYKRRLSMTPGLTGMWQVSGRSSITDFDEVVKLDLEYIDNWSVGLDIKILFFTIVTVLFRRGAV